MLEESDPYVLGGTQTEQQRLVAQAAEFEVQTRWVLDQINFHSGACAVDIGCDPIGILVDGGLSGAPFGAPILRG